MQFLSSFGSILLILLGFGFLIFVHELGHFAAAKWAGIRTEGFAIGMGPVVAAWRRGIGVTIGSTDRKVVSRTGKHAHELTDSELERAGIGETEYSLRWLPLGGFVKMLGQEDVGPAPSSNDPRSYGRCPVPKRMVVVSAGVVMNVLLALALFVVAFLVGVRFEAPIVGAVDPSAPAGTTWPEDHARFGVPRPGLRMGDRVLAIDGDAPMTFADVQIEIAMSRPGLPVMLEVERDGFDEPLRFALEPTPGREGLLSIGIEPERSTTLRSGEGVALLLAEAELTGVEPGMRLIEVDGVPVALRSEFQQRLDASQGRPLVTRWTAVDEHGAPTGPAVTATLVPAVKYDPILHRDERTGEAKVDPGLLGLTPLVEVGFIDEKSPNRDLFRVGDVVVRAGSIPYPRATELQALAKENVKKVLPVTVRRDGAEVTFDGTVDDTGRFGIVIAAHTESLVTATPIGTRLVPAPRGGAVERATPVASADLLPGTTIASVSGIVVRTWPDFRRALRDAVGAGRRPDGSAAIELEVIHPTPGAERQTMRVELSPEEAAAFNAVGWASPVPTDVFEPHYATLTAGGNPFRAVAMGFHRTHKAIVMTYLTIDRLFRGSVGVDQLRGPVGIIDLGHQILPRGLMYFLFFLGVISVNLAVINFLPLPIVDGGLFLYLVYEKVKGRPPSPQFQNVATVIGLCLIGAIFVVTFYNDIMRLIG
jgi:regulator of sigma E protease